MKIRIEKKPDSGQMETFRKHLLAEWNETNQGFYSNIFESPRLPKGIWLVYDEESYLGFVCRNKIRPFVEISMFSIDFRKRKSGFGTVVYQAIESELIRKGYLAIKLNSIDPSSDAFWIKNGFEKPPITAYSESDRTLIKYISSRLNCQNMADIPNRIELWEVDSYLIERFKPKWTWNIDPANIQKDKHSIIQYCDGDWHLRIFKNGQIVFDSKVKRYKNGEKYVSGFLYIEDWSLE